MDIQFGVGQNWTIEMLHTFGYNSKTLLAVPA